MDDNLEEYVKNLRVAHGITISRKPKLRIAFSVKCTPATLREVQESLLWYKSYTVSLRGCRFELEEKETLQPAPVEPPKTETPKPRGKPKPKKAKTSKPKLKNPASVCGYD